MLEAASREVERLDKLRDIFREAGELVAQHNQLARQKEIPGIGPSHVSWPEISKRADRLIEQLEHQQGKFGALTALHDQTADPEVKEEVEGLLHVISSLISEYKEILEVVVQSPQTVIMMWTREVVHMDEAAERTRRLIRGAVKPPAAS